MKRCSTTYTYTDSLNIQLVYGQKCHEYQQQITNIICQNI